MDFSKDCLDEKAKRWEGVAADMEKASKEEDTETKEAKKATEKVETAETEKRRKRKKLVSNTKKGR